MKKKLGFFAFLGFAFTLIAVFFAINSFYPKTQPSSTTGLESRTAQLLSLDAVTGNAQRKTFLGKAKTLQPPKKESSVLLNDPNMSQKWGISLINSKKAWTITQGNKNIVVAVIDTGIDLKHEDLEENLWTNPGESGKDSNGKDRGNNGIDDDKNGYVDDVHGWNFALKNNDLTDNHGHGTHISGIIGAKGGNKKGIVGVSPNVSLMTLKYYDPKALGANNLESTVKAIHYAIENGARIINYSGGGLEFSEEEKTAVEKAQKRGILFVAAAGNEHSNSDQKKYYPADYDLSNIISVTAIDSNKNILPSSNYGVVTVDIAAPGKHIYSTLPNGRYGHMTGTSQATAFVSGVAALIMANNSDFNATQVAKYITNTGDVVSSLQGKTRYNRKLNSYRALSIMDQGVAATGVVADNISNLKSDAFSSEKFNFEDENDQVDPMLKFSSSLLDKIKNKKRSINSRAPNSNTETED